MLLVRNLHVSHVFGSTKAHRIPLLVHRQVVRVWGSRVLLANTPLGGGSSGLGASGGHPERGRRRDIFSWVQGEAACRGKGGEKLRWKLYIF